MISVLTDPNRAAALFAGWEDTMILSCLQGVMGKVYANHPEDPDAAMAVLADFVFYAGKPDRALVMGTPKGHSVLVPPDEAWARLIEDCFPGAEKETRFAIRKDTRFSKEHLAALASSLPPGYSFRRIDAEVYDLCLAEPLFTDGVCHFGSKERYLSLGRGLAVMKDGQVVSICSSYTRYREGIELEVDTAEPERRKGLASAVCAGLILSCLEEGLYPSWDAANRASVRLAEKLGYVFSHEYVCYWIG